MRRWESALGALQGEFERRERELNLLRYIDRAILEKTPILNLFEYVADELANLYNAPNVAVLLRRGDDLRTEYASNIGAREQRLSVRGTLQGGCIERIRTENIGNISEQDPGGLFQDYPGGHTRSALMTPIRENELAVGLIVVFRDVHGGFDSQAEEFIEAVASQLSVAVEHAHFFDEVQLYTEVDSMIFQSSRTQSIVDAALVRIVAELEHSGANSIDGTQILFPRDGALEVVYSTNPADLGVVVSAQSVSGTAITEGRTVFIPDVRDRQYRDIYRAMLPDMRSELAVPVRVSNVPIAVLNFESRKVNAFSGYEQALLQRFAGKIAIMLAFARLKDDVIAAMEQQAANELFVTIGEETANMVHDINSAVGAARLWNSKAKGRLGSVLDQDDELRQLFERLDGALARALERPRQLQERMNRQRNLDVYEALRSALESTSDERFAQIHIDTSAVPTDLPQTGTSSLDRVFENLFRNSAEAIGSDRPGNIWISARRIVLGEVDRDWLEIVVEDDGPGVPPEKRRVIFEPGVGTKSERDGNGLGFGLWWVKLFLNRIGGDIEAHDRVGGGARFVLRLPTEKRGIPHNEGN